MSKIFKNKSRRGKDMDIYKRIVQIFEESNLNQRELAKKLKTSQTTISNIKNETYDIKTSILTKICEEFQVSADWIIFGEENTDTANKPPERNFSKQQQELLEITDKMTDQQQTELLGAVKMFLINSP